MGDEKSGSKDQPGKKPSGMISQTGRPPGGTVKGNRVDQKSIDENRSKSGRDGKNKKQE